MDLTTHQKDAIVAEIIAELRSAVDVVVEGMVLIACEELQISLDDTLEHTKEDLYTYCQEKFTELRADILDTTE